MEQFFLSYRLHNMSWVIAVDFNKPLIGEDKFGGRLVSVNKSLFLKECLDKCNMIDLGVFGTMFHLDHSKRSSGFNPRKNQQIFCQSKLVFALPKSKSNSSY